MQTATLLQHLFASWPGFAALLVLPVLIKLIASLFFQNRMGEMRVLSALRGLDTATYHHFHNLDLPHPTEQHATIRVEHVVVSPYGIFVIATTDRRGWILGSEHEPQWVQRIHWRRSHFENPLQQNRVMVDALMSFLHLPDPPFHPVVVFRGDCAFKIPLPGVALPDALIPWIRRHTVTMLDSSMLARAVSRLENHQNSLTREVDDKLQLHTLHVRQAV